MDKLVWLRMSPPVIVKSKSEACTSPETMHPRHNENDHLVIAETLNHPRAIGDALHEAGAGRHCLDEHMMLQILCILSKLCNHQLA